MRKKRSRWFSRLLGRERRRSGQAVTGDEILRFQRLVRKVPASESVIRHAVRLVRSTRPGDELAPDFVRNWVSYGASLRASQYLILGGRARALMKGRYHVTYEDVRKLALSVFRHRILINFHAESENVTPDQIVQRLLEGVPPPAPDYDPLRNSTWKRCKPDSSIRPCWPNWAICSSWPRPWWKGSSWGCTALLTTGSVSISPIPAVCAG